MSTETEPVTLEQIRSELAEIKARQAASEAVKDRLPSPRVPSKRVLFHNQLAESQERARVARCRAAELAHLEAEGVARRDQPRREKIEKKLAPLEQRMQAIFSEQQALELELQDLGRRRIALAVELNPPKPVPVATIGLRPEDKFIRANGTMRRVRA
jgi:hypothetical protein